MHFVDVLVVIVVPVYYLIDWCVEGYHDTWKGSARTLDVSCHSFCGGVIGVPSTAWKTQRRTILRDEFQRDFARAALRVNASAWFCDPVDGAGRQVLRWNGYGRRQLTTHTRHRRPVAAWVSQRRKHTNTPTHTHTQDTLEDLTGN